MQADPLSRLIRHFWRVTSLAVRSALRALTRTTRASPRPSSRKHETCGSSSRCRRECQRPTPLREPWCSQSQDRESNENLIGEENVWDRSLRAIEHISRRPAMDEAACHYTTRPEGGFCERYSVMD